MLRIKFRIRMQVQLEVSALTGKKMKGCNDSIIKEHHLFCNHVSDLTIFPY